MENIVWSSSFSPDTVVIEPQLGRYFYICECQRYTNGEVKVRKRYWILTMDGKEGVNVTTGMEVSEPRVAEGAVKRCQTFDWRALRPEGMVKNRMFHVESSAR